MSHSEDQEASQPLPANLVGRSVPLGEFVMSGPKSVPLGEFVLASEKRSGLKSAGDHLPANGVDDQDATSYDMEDFKEVDASPKPDKEKPSYDGASNEVPPNDAAVSPQKPLPSVAESPQEPAPDLVGPVQKPSWDGILSPDGQAFDPFQTPQKPIAALESPRGDTKASAGGSLTQESSPSAGLHSRSSKDSEDDDQPSAPFAVKGVARERKKRSNSVSIDLRSAQGWLRSLVPVGRGGGRGSEPNTPQDSPRSDKDGTAEKRTPRSVSLGPVRAPVAEKSLLDLARRISFGLDKTKLEVGSKAQDASKFSILAPIDTKERLEFLREMEKDPYCKRAMGALVGMAVGDSVGAPLEFIPVGTKGSRFDAKTLKLTGEFNKFSLNPGQWTDDTSMGLCIADSLLVHKTYEPSDIRVRFWSWWNRGYNNAFRFDDSRSKSVGLGGNIAASLSAIHSNHPPARFNAPSTDAGNGSIMRLAALPLYFFKDIDLCIRVCAESSYTTHPGNIAADACAFLGYLIARALTRPMKKESPQRFVDSVVASYLVRPEVALQPELMKLLNSVEAPTSLERCWNWRDPKGPYLEETIANRGEDYNGHPVNASYMGSYSMDGLAIALHSFYHTNSYLAAITKCVNFLGDADTTAAICGQMAGCFYGVDGIDWRLIQRLKQWDDGDIALRGALVYLLGLQHTEDMKRTARERSMLALAIDEQDQPPPCPPERAIPMVPSARMTAFGLAVAEPREEKKTPDKRSASASPPPKKGAAKTTTTTTKVASSQSRRRSQERYSTL